MKEAELQIQKKLVDVFMELESEIATTSSEQNCLGWRQRNALISHVYSNYTMHDELNLARNKWKAMTIKHNVLDWLYETMRKNHDLHGYFENYKQLIEEIISMWEYAIKREQFKVADILKTWVEKLPKIETIQMP